MILSNLPSSWPLASIFMHVDVRGVQDSNGDGMGDLPGLIARLDHFQECGIGALFLSGLMPCDFAYSGTMPTEFYDVDPRLGTLADFDQLIAEAHARQIAILISWSPFSTHPDHAYFQASRDPAHPDHAEFRDFYLWADDINTRQPRRMGHWEWDALRGAYHHTVWLTVDMRWCPEVNLLNPRARAENEKVVRFWLERGADGFMIDCAVWGGFTSAEEHVRFSREMTGVIHGYPHKWVISEGSRSIRDTVVTDGYDSFYTQQARKVPVYETVFRKPGLGTLVEYFPGMESHGIHEALFAYYDDPHGNQIMNPFKVDHPLDFSRPEDLARTKLAQAIHLTLPLIPYTFFPLHAGLAPESRQDLTRFHPFLMMWDDKPNFGFSSGTPFEPQNVDGYPAHATAAAQLRDPDSILSSFRAVARLRQAHPALQSRHPAGQSYARLPTGDDANSFSYLRFEPDSRQAAVVVTNLLAEAQRYTLDFSRSRRVMEILGARRRLARFGGQVGSGPQEIELDPHGQARIELPAYGFGIYDVCP